MQMERLFMNLIENAVKYRGEAPPQIRVAAERQDDAWEFSVADNGIGIAPEFREKVFDDLRAAARPRQIPGIRHRPGLLPPHRRAPRRHDLGRSDAGRRHDLPFHAARQAGGEGERRCAVS